MKLVIRGLALALAVTLPPSGPIAAAAQSSRNLLQNSRIEIEYVKPAKSHLLPIYERMKKREVLEQLQQFLSPLRLDVKLRITMYECGATNSFWEGRSAGLALCYEWPDWLERLAPADKTPDGYLREDVILGGFLQVTLHELGHALFDIYNVPMFGREEDAADQIAGFILTQFGKNVARRTLPGTAYFWRRINDQETWSRDDFSDTHGTPLQRTYNFLCIAYGADPDLFKDYVAAGLLPAERAANCAREYRQIGNAFVKTILPHVDRELMKEVQARDWLRPEDGK